MHRTFRTEHKATHLLYWWRYHSWDHTDAHGIIHDKREKKKMRCWLAVLVFVAFCIVKTKNDKKYRWIRSIFHLAPRTVLFALVAMLATIKAGSIRLLTLSGPLFLIGYCRTSIWINIQQVIFMIWGRGGSNSIGRSKIIILAPHTWGVFG